MRHARASNPDVAIVVLDLFTYAGSGPVSMASRISRLLRDNSGYRPRPQVTRRPQYDDYRPFLLLKVYRSIDRRIPLSKQALLARIACSGSKGEWIERLRPHRFTTSRRTDFGSGTRRACFPVKALLIRPIRHTQHQSVCRSSRPSLSSHLPVWRRQPPAARTTESPDFQKSSFRSSSFRHFIEGTSSHLCDGMNVGDWLRVEDHCRADDCRSSASMAR